MRKANYKKKQRLKNVGTATALTITLATSNVSILAYAMELENDINEEVVAEEVIAEEETRKKKATKQEPEVEVQEQEVIVQEEVNAQEQEIDVQNTNNQPTVDNFNLNDWEHKSYTNDIILNVYKGLETEIVIPGEINGKAVKIGTVNCFENIKSTITSLTFKEVDGKKVQTPDSLANAFNEFTALTSIDLSGLNTSSVNNMAYMFRGCTKLKSIEFGNTFNTENVTTMQQMFRNCSSLINLDLTNFTTVQVQDMSYMFNGCTKLKSIEFGNKFNTSQTKNMRYIFDGCASLTSLNLINFDTSQVTNMDNMFKDCSSLTSLNLSNFNTENVTSMQQMFIGCSSLINLDISSFNTENVEKMNNMFKDCPKLETIEYGNSFNTSSVTDMSYMFSGSTVSELDLRNLNTENATNMQGMFYNTKNLKTIIFGENFNTENVTDMSEMFSNSGVESLNLKNFNTENVTNMAGMFNNTENLKNIEFGAEFETSKVTDMSYMFYNSGVESLDLRNFNTSKVTNMDLMFARLNNTIVLDLSNFNLDTVTKDDMEYMFAKNIILNSDGNLTTTNDAKELLVISKDEKIKDYPFASEGCLPVGPTLDANGGKFNNGDTIVELKEINVLESLNEDYINKVIQDKIASVANPIRYGYRFISWETSPTTVNSSILDKLNTVYYAKWDKNTDGGIIAPDVGVTPSVTECKLVGEDRYKTAIAVSNEGWNKSDNVVVVNSSAIVDALSATPFAKFKDAPILLTKSNALNDETEKEIIRLGAKNIYVIGGTDVVSENVISQLKAMNLNVDRISGNDRYTTSLEIAKRLNNVSEIAVVNGVTGLADAVSIAPVAASRNMPIVLSSQNEGTKTFDEFIKSNNIKTSYVIGREAVISEDIASKLPNSSRLGGLNRNETNAIILEKFYTNKNLNNIFVAKDGMKKEDELIDALAVGVLASKENSPVVIVGDKLDTKQEKLLKSKNPKEVTQVGGNGNENAFSQIVNMFK